MTAILDDWNALVKKLAQNIREYVLLRERRLIALILIKGGTIAEIAQVIDPHGPVTPQAVYLNHPTSEISHVKSDIAVRLAGEQKEKT